MLDYCTRYGNRIYINDLNNKIYYMIFNTV